MARMPCSKSFRLQLVALIDELFPPQSFGQWPEHGNCQWTMQKLVWVTLLMTWVPGNTLNERFCMARRIVKKLKPRWHIPIRYEGFVQAQQRSWNDCWNVLTARLRPSESWANAWRVKGWVLFAVDGSRFECPRTVANENGLGCAGREKTGPQIFQTTLQHVGTGLPWEIRVGPGTDSERFHLNDMLPTLPEQSMLTADAGFMGYPLCVSLCQKGHPFIIRVGGNITLLTALWEVIESEENIVFLWPLKYRNQPPLRLRKIQFCSPGGLPVVLLTNVLDPAVLSDEDAQCLYACRWPIELHFRAFKQTWDFGQLLSRTPITAIAEHQGRLLGYWTLQYLVSREQARAGRDPRRWSAAGARKVIRDILALLDEERMAKSGDKKVLIRLREARQDDYQRLRPKVTRVWPRKKTDEPPQPPQIHPATAAESKRAKRHGSIIQLIL